ncbi:MAG TPA: zinc-ribbon and DUF3426 domain-containing protein [Gammaproteobacteria bacterium]|nr:zinc-ribbon and DUF3426 domain-containing protein [Gammaproteobacteria bacterium]
MILVTSCPECTTTFRISVGILEKAGGQVRCGRCARIFDANAKLREVEESEIEARPAPAFKFELQPDPEIGSPAESEDRDSPERDDVLADADDARDDEPPQPRAEPGAAAAPAAVIGPGSSVKRSEPGTAAAEPEHIVLETLTGTHESPGTGESHAADESSATRESRELPDWLLPASESQPPRTQLWAVGVALATLALVGQLVHHYRAELVAQPAIGPVLALAYAGFGAELQPPVDLDQYRLQELTAVAEPSGEEQGWLVIETRVHNNGPSVQPYPHIFVRLLDRWEDTVAARYFAPEEYAVTSIPDVDRMSVGSTVDAQFIIMDPGPSATGFELELCFESSRGFECESDDAGE